MVSRNLSLRVEHNLVWTLHESTLFVACNATNFFALRPGKLFLEISEELILTCEVHDRLRCAWLLTYYFWATSPFFLLVLLLFQLFLLKVFHKDLIFLCKRSNCGRWGCQCSYVRNLLWSGIKLVIIDSNFKSLAFVRGMDSTLRDVLV